VEGNRTISRRHARITNENGVFFIEDLQSMNHTYLNDKQLAEKERAVLRNGDHIRLANEEFIFLMR
jgi:pSer/pThr/pTyr-binding forkhead associated (FHA) protein